MPGLLAYAAAGAAAGVGAGIVERAKQLREDGLLKLKMDREDAQRQQDHDWRLDEIGLRDSLKGGGGGRRRSGGGGGGESVGDLAPGESVYSSGGGGGGGLMPSAGAARPDPMALEAQGTSNPDEYKTYGYDDPAPAAADGAAAAPAEDSARVPDVSHTPSKLSGEKEIDGYLFGRAGNRWYPYIGPDGGPVKAEGAEEAKREPYLPKQDQEAPSLVRPEVERYAPERERPKPDTNKPKPSGLLPSQTMKEPTVDSADVPKDGPVTKLPKGEPVALKPSSVNRLERSLRDSRGQNLDAQAFSKVVDEIENLMGEGKTEAQATNDVMSRLAHEEIVTNPAGTMASRLLGLTSKDAPPDAVKEGKVTGVKPRPEDLANTGPLSLAPRKGDRLIGVTPDGRTMFGAAEDDFPKGSNDIRPIDGPAEQKGGLKAAPADVLKQAQEAVAKGVSRDKIAARLRELGYTDAGI
jgi:hypothetical protein